MSITASTMPPLPALRDLGGRLPCVIIDTREQEPLPIRRLPTIRAGLYSGDYSVAGLENIFAVERKSVADLVACCTAANRERFVHELHRLRGYRFRRLLIVGARVEIEQGRYRSHIKPAAVLGSLAAWEIRFDVPIVYEPDPVKAGTMVETWAWYAAREAIHAVNGVQRTPSRE